MRLFEGYEAEGRFRGMWTLFVAGDVPFEVIEKFLDKTDRQKKHYHQVYFGADNRTYVNWDTVTKCKNYYKLWITVELSAPMPLITAIDHADNLSVIIPVQNQPDLQSIIDSARGNVRCIQFKFETEKRVYVWEALDVVENSKVEYTEDRELWK